MAKKHSKTYIELIDLLFKMSGKSAEGNIYSHTMNNGKYERSNVGKSTKVFQPIVISDMSLCDICTDSEWRLVRLIIKDLKEYNALWHCISTIKSNGTYQKAIRGLIDKNILKKTETTNIYLVNPFYIRRGDLWAVITTTANSLVDSPAIGIEHIVNRKPVKTFTPIERQVGYGYAPDNNEEIFGS